MADTISRPPRSEPRRRSGRTTHAQGRRVRLARVALVASIGFVSVVLTGCATREPPGADQPPPPPPHLAGQGVMLLPVQPTRGAGPAGLDEELAYWFGEHARAVRWVFPPTLERALERSPGLGIHLRSLAVSSFFRAEVRRIGDPLFGDLRRLSALVDARFAIVPIAAAYVERPGEDGRVEIAAAVIETVGGRVHWFGVIAGESGPEDAPATAASAAQALARTLFP